jgi:chaperonin GroES
MIQSELTIKIKNMSKINITPLADRVIIKQAAAETTTASGIIIPDTAQEKPQKGSVIAVGKGTKDNPITVKAGNTVLYGKYAGTELKHEGEDYLIMKESDILAIIK